MAVADETERLLPGRKTSYTADERNRGLGDDNVIGNDTLNRDSNYNLQRRNRFKYAIILLGSLVGFFVVCVTVFTCTKIAEQTPSNELMQKAFMEMTDWNITEIKINGWSDPFLQDHTIVYNKFNWVNSKEKYLQFDVKLNTVFHYDKIQNDTLTVRQQKYFRRINEGLVKNICIDLKNVTTWDLDQNETNLGSLISGSPICVSLKDNETNQLTLHLYFKPEIKNYWKIVKKVWNHDYDDIHLVSNLKLGIKFFIFHLETKYLNLNNVTINWHDLMKKYDLEHELKFFRENWPPNIQLLDLELLDTEDGFNVIVTLKEIFNFVKVWFEERLPILKFSDSLITVLPKIFWDIKLPDCKEKFAIGLPNANSTSRELETWDGKNWEPIVDINLNGPLPNDLVNKVCDSDDENIKTPLTNIINTLLNETELVTFQMKGRVSDINTAIVSKTKRKRAQDEILDNNLLNHDMLNSLFDEMSYFPIQPNVTFNVSKLIQEFDIMNMKFQRSGNRLSVLGTMQGIINLPFYKTNDERFFVNNIKANLELYHKGTHFMSLPMKIWTKSTSKILHDSETGMTQLQVQFDVDDKDMEITNHFEMTKVVNEIIFMGKTLISFESVTDIIIDSLLGEIIINGLNTSGETVVH